MADDENKLKIEEEEEITAGKNNELKVNEAEKKKKEELNLQESGDISDNDEKNEATVTNDSEEPIDHSGRWEFRDIEEEDISKYLWKVLLSDIINKGLKYLYGKATDGVDAGIRKHDRGPAAADASKDKKVKHTAERAKDLYEAAATEADAFEKTIPDSLRKPPASLNGKAECDRFSKILCRADTVAYNLAASEFLHEKMKDKGFDFATMDKGVLIKEQQQRILEKHEKMMAGVMATYFYSQNIEGMSAQEILKACEEYVSIREKESEDIKSLIMHDLEKGNIVANDKKPNRDIGVKINAFNQSFAKEALILPEAVRSATTLLKENSLSADEMVGLESLAKTENAFRIFENTTLVDIRAQAKALDEVIKRNKDNPTRATIAAMKSKLGLNPVTANIFKKHANNAILKAINKNKGGRAS